MIKATWHSLNPVGDIVQYVQEPEASCSICESHPHHFNLIPHNKGGLLCPSCNAGLSYFKENEKLLENALEYLRGHHD